MTREVERLYAGLDLPALRRAVDPRNAHRPILLIGEPGTRRGLLARYVHNLAEPARDAFVPFALRSLASGELENAVMTRTASRRVTAYLEDVDRAGATLQDELAHLLGASGALALEPLRWVASASSSRGLSRSLRDLAWLRVELPPLRSREDEASLIDAAFRSCAERQVPNEPGELVGGRLSAELEVRGDPQNRLGKPLGLRRLFEQIQAFFRKSWGRSDPKGWWIGPLAAAAHRSEGLVLREPGHRGGTVPAVAVGGPGRAVDRGAATRYEALDRDAPRPL